MANGNDDEAERMVVTRTFDAPCALVWKAWTDPDSIVRWWGPKDFTVASCAMDFRVGGKFLCCMRAPDGQEFWNACDYFEIVPQEKIVFSMYFADSGGKKVEPAQYGIEHEAIDGAKDVVLFEDVGAGRTRLTFIGNETMASATESGQVEGWYQIFDQLAKLVAEMGQVGGA